MANELIIHARAYETRVALVENGVVVELHIERKTGQELMGNIYRGRVVRVLPGMQAAFVDIGLDRSAFLYVSDIHQDLMDLERLMLRDLRDHTGEESPASMREGIVRENDVPVPSLTVEELLREGQDIMVQISKEPLGTKGARLTSYVSLPGRHLVLLPTVNHIGVSRKIEEPVERERLKSMVLELRQGQTGFIVRTASEGADRSKLKSEMDFLLKLWNGIQEKMARSTGPCLLYRELSISLRSVRDLFAREVDRLIIDSAEEYNLVMEFIDTFAPGLRYSVELYDGAEPIFDYYGIEMEISRAVQKKIWLKSGGYIVIESTEALIAIDVNTGSYVGTRNLEETILKTNLEAVKEIALQLRLRNLGGLIVIDFIDMERKANRERVFTALKEALSKDKAKTHILKMSELGLIEMTRKRTRENLSRVLGEPCFYCEGRGLLKSKKTICYEIFRALEREAALSGDNGNLYVVVNPVMDSALKEEEQQSIVELEKRINRRIIIQTREHFHLEQYEVTIQPPV
ncbi:MAG: Rne/Rng family ribonuclease [Deltaproteobacteria bacterium]|nr:Rne/Rng family ribonuclease [Deltaproteobacteria bacterium]